MDREVKGESAEWAELRKKLFDLLDRVHEQREREKEREERKHGMKVSVSVRVYGKAKKRKNQKGLIKI